MPDVPSLSELSLNAAYGLHSQDAAMSVPLAQKHLDIIGILPKPLHELALVALKDAYRTLVLQPYEMQIKQQQTEYTDYSTEDLASELSTKLTLKETEGFKTLYWLARANNLQAIVSFIETEKKDCSLIFFSETRNTVVSKIAELGDQENIDKLLSLASDPLERISMLTSGIWGACKGGQVNILAQLFGEKCQTEDDKASCQNYFTENLSSLFSNACASGNLDSVEFVLEQVPEAEHKVTISEVYEGFGFNALREACRSGNPQVVDRLLKPFSQKEIDRIFLPPSKETKNLLLPFAYASILSYDSIKINQHILTNIVSSECREKIVTSESFVQSLAKAYGNQDKERSLGLLTQVPHQQFELVRQGVGLEIDKQGQEAIKQKFEKDCKDFKGSLSESKSKSRLVGSQYFFGMNFCSKKNESIQKTRLGDSLFFSHQEQKVDEIEKGKKEKQRCQKSRLTKN